ncbi:MAG: hypothetical protein NTY12_05655 [Candidatus Falkowbacteria bacterium]|nr:hypothetical protein [Candidatus Falkowbacteria bacterium]
MLIHFICSGNTNRSRMAEAYLNSKKIPGLNATSSGIWADHNLNGPIVFFVRDMLEEEGLLQYTAESWQKTSKEILDKVDIVIFMKQHHFDFVKNELGYVPPRYYIWDVEDVSPDQASLGRAKQLQEIEQDKTIFIKIKQKVDQLILELQKEL